MDGIFRCKTGRATPLTPSYCTCGSSAMICFQLLKWKMMYRQMGLPVCTYQARRNEQLLLASLITSAKKVSVPSQFLSSTDILYFVCCKTFIVKGCTVSTSFEIQGVLPHGSNLYWCMLLLLHISLVLCWGSECITCIHVREEAMGGGSGLRADCPSSYAMY